MRPKKTILLSCADPAQREMLSFNLTVWGYKVTRCGSAHHPCLECLAKRRYDLLLVVSAPAEQGEPAPEAFVPLFEAQEARGDAVLLLDHGRTGRWWHPMDFRWTRVGGSHCELRDAARMAVSRKRGPKPRRRPEASVVAEPAVAA